MLEAEYTTSINIHAPLEPMNATAEFKGDILHIYSGNQFATRSGAIAAGAAGIDPKFVVMHQMWLGGGFGRRLDADMMVPAVQAAKAVGKPVKVIYSRENDMTMDYSRPLTFQKVKAGLDADGKLIALNHDVVQAWPTARWGIPDFLSPSVDKKGPLDAFTVNGADFFYSVPNHNVRAIKNEMAHNATPSGQLRSVAPGWTFWAVESMIDELAHAAGKDPAQYRIALLDGKGKNDGGAQRLRNTLLAAMGMAGYGTTKLPKGEGMGVACVSSQERATASWTACVAHVAVAPSGEVKVKKLTVATDVGTQVHPDNIRAQVEGAALWGLSLAMYEKATLKDGGIEQTNFDTYTPLRMSADAGSRHQRHRQWREAHRRRRAGGDGGRARARQRDLQRLRRPRPRAADHRGSGEGEHEGVGLIASLMKMIRRRLCFRRISCSGEAKGGFPLIRPLGWIGGLREPAPYAR